MAGTWKPGYKPFGLAMGPKASGMVVCGATPAMQDEARGDREGHPERQDQGARKAERPRAERAAPADTPAPVPADPARCTASASASARCRRSTTSRSTIAAGEIHCLLGENGAGKSTLCNVVFGVHQPDAGDDARWTARRTGRAAGRGAGAAGIAMVHQHFSLVDDLTVRRQPAARPVARLCSTRGDCAAHVRRAVASSTASASRPTRVSHDLSVGERQRVEIVKCLMREPRLLVLDEPTAVLLPAEIDALLDVCERVAARGCGVVLVTHKLAEIRRIAHRVHRAASRPRRGASAAPADGHRSPRARDDPARPEAPDDAMLASRLSLAHAATTSPVLAPARRRSRCRSTASTARDADGVRAARRLHARRAIAARSSASPASRATARANSARCSSGMMRGQRGRFFVARPRR